MHQQSSPTADELEARIRSLFEARPRPAVDLTPPEGSPYRLAATVEDLTEALRPVATMLEVREGNSDQDAADAWLDTPSPALGGLCPRSFLHGTEAQWAFLAGIVDSIEDAAFS